MLNKQRLEELYIDQKLSVADMAKIFECSENKVNYWLDKYKVKKRSISEAIYLKHNPNGDPFTITEPGTIDEAILYGLGLGLYWGEGTKRSNSVRLGNTDPKLIKKFIEFLIQFYDIEKARLKFGLQLFSDIDPEEAKLFWMKTLRIKSNQFYKVTKTDSRGNGSYKDKIKYGVLTVYFNNVKLRNRLVEAIDDI